jgi:hypothetical protein
MEPVMKKRLKKFFAMACTGIVRLMRQHTIHSFKPGGNPMFEKSGQ